VYQYRFRFATEPGASYKVYYKTVGGPNQETVDEDGHAIPDGPYTDTGLTANGTAIDDGIVQLLWTLPAQRQKYQFKVVGAAADHLDKEIQTSTASAADDAIAVSVNTPAQIHTTNFNSYYKVTATGPFAFPLRAGESVDIYGAKTTTVNGVVSSVEHSVKLYTIDTTTDIPAASTGSGITYDGSSYYFSVTGSAATTSVTASDFDFVYTAK
jgi:hypothetical protein